MTGRTVRGIAWTLLTVALAAFAVASDLTGWWVR